VYHSLDQWHSEAGIWGQREYDLSAFLGQTVTLYVGTRNDGDDDTAAMYVDDVMLDVCP
jgi:bacillopeptidase F (M6 metalloprotease family)